MGSADSPASMRCLECGCSEGGSRRVRTSLPNFGEVDLVSFSCTECGETSSAVEPAASPRQKGFRVSLQVDGPEDLDRVLVKSPFCTLRIASAALEIGSGDLFANICSVRDALLHYCKFLRLIAGLEQESIASKAEARLLIERIDHLLLGREPFVVEIDDPSGNSCIHGTKDRLNDAAFYTRSAQQNFLIASRLKPGRQLQAAAAQASKPIEVDAWAAETFDAYMEEGEGLVRVPGTCSCCDAITDVEMRVVSLPQFKDAIFSVSSCDNCGEREHRVQPVGAASSRGRRCVLQVQSADDLERDILKSETSSVEIPELGLEMMSGTLGGKYTTLAGILEGMFAQLQHSVACVVGDGDDDEVTRRRRLKDWTTRFSALMQVQTPFTFILDDPMANCFINPNADDDRQLTNEQYERSGQQNRDLGRAAASTKQ